MCKDISMPKNRKETYSDRQSSASRAKRKTPEQKLAEFSDQIANTANQAEPRSSTQKPSSQKGSDSKKK
jgi:hypothetical protein